MFFFKQISIIFFQMLGIAFSNYLCKQLLATLVSDLQLLALATSSNFHYHMQMTFQFKVYLANSRYLFGLINNLFSYFWLVNQYFQLKSAFSSRQNLYFLAVKILCHYCDLCILVLQSILHIFPLFFISIFSSLASVTTSYKIKHCL